MPIIKLITIIHAPIERCFDLSRNLDLHMTSSSQTGEKAVGGITHGLINFGEEVTWKAKHFGVWQQLTSRITAYERPHHFRDSMVRGAFKRIDHDHFFESQGDATKMIDVFNFNAPLGLLGTIAESFFLTNYLKRFLEERNVCIKNAAESDEWKYFLPTKNL